MEKELIKRERTRAALNFQVKSLQQRIDIRSIQEVRKCHQIASSYLFCIKLFVVLNLVNTKF